MNLVKQKRGSTLRAVLVGLALVGMSAGVARLGLLGLKPQVILMGRFHHVAHLGSGTATVVEQPNGTRTLRLEDTHTDPGKDLQVCLVAAPEAFDNETVEEAGFVPLGAFSDSPSPLEYRIPPTIDWNRYGSVAIWSPIYRVNFITAPLRSPERAR